MHCIIHYALQVSVHVFVFHAHEKSGNAFLSSLEILSMYVLFLKVCPRLKEKQRKHG
jgi:hypothetical protein